MVKDSTTGKASADIDDIDDIDMQDVGGNTHDQEAVSAYNLRVLNLFRNENFYISSLRCLIIRFLQVDIDDEDNNAGTGAATDNIFASNQYIV